FFYEQNYIECSNILNEVVPIFFKQYGIENPDTLFVLRFLGNEKLKHIPIMKKTAQSLIDAACKIHQHQIMASPKVSNELNDIYSNLFQ
ncbi:MAG TPA: hypothetical protein VEW28_00480, partial [Candidatus Kapabacteria bacterium]|nr:hypothetical protein [Candidatus Kapabacteria bacterium]